MKQSPLCLLGMPGLILGTALGLLFYINQEAKLSSITHPAPILEEVIHLQHEEVKMDATQLRDLITEVLHDIDLYSEEAVELLMLTAAVESNLGEYIKQVKGPARGFFQMEPATEHDIWTNYLSYKKELEEKLNPLLLREENSRLRRRSLDWSLAYQVAMARIHYLRVPKPLPKADDVEGLAKYWKDHYNTYLGAGTVEKAIEKYNRYVAS